MQIRYASVLVLGALSAASGRLSAQTAGDGVSYSSSAECPDERHFRDELSLHLRSGPVPLARSIVVEAEQLEAHSIARVRFVDENGALSVREISAPTCAEVVTAAALVVALAIDSREQLEKRPVAAAPEQRRQGSSNAPMIDDRPARPDVPTRLFIEFGAGVLAHMAVAPDPMLGATGFVGIGEQASWDLRGAFVYAKTSEVTRDARAAKFSFLAGRLDGCALPLVKRNRLLLSPCLAVELGAVHSAGIETEHYTPSEQATFWMGAGPLLRAKAIFGSLGLEAYAGPWFPIVGPENFVTVSDDGERSFHEVPLVGVLAGLNVSLAMNMN